ncbi:MAG: helix-turn-helix domain-containing protein [Myxococcales bacterium]|nr:helix-turn-helix domain-containing protein [Myxococcales bacterium]
MTGPADLGALAPIVDGLADAIAKRIAALLGAPSPARLDVRAAAERIGCGPRAILDARRHGELEGVRVGRGWRFDLAEVDRWAGSRSAAKLATAGLDARAIVAASLPRRSRAT